MLKLVMVVIAGVALGILTTAAFACNDTVYTNPPPQVQTPPTDNPQS
jgi:hypothetical protein